MVKLTTKASSLLASCCLVLAIGVYFYRDADPFDYFYLSLRWPPSFCNTGQIKCRKVLPGNFTIHGLWAQKTKYRHYACDSPYRYPFDYAELQKHEELISRMRKSWPNLVEKKKNQGFWKREWEKHGSCTFKSEQAEYFMKTCNMWEQAALLSFFNASGITPGYGASYSLKQYTEAIAKAIKLKKAARFTCNKDKEGTEQLFEVRLCTNKDATEFVECPENRQSLSSPRSHRCKDSIKIAFPKVDAVAVM